MTQHPEIDFSRIFYFSRWLAVPLMVIAALCSTFTQDSFQWSAGPYGYVFGSWFIGYVLWAGHTSMAGIFAYRQSNTANEKTTARQELSSALETHHASNHAVIELFAAIIVLIIARLLPEYGFAIIGLSASHILFVITWRQYDVSNRHSTAT